MGIRLDWEVQAERARVPHLGEDPAARRARRAQQKRGCLLVIAVVLVVAIAGGLVALRLRAVEAEIEDGLRAVVLAETAAVRVGDRAAFLEFQRSATDEWAREQAAAFERYQALKLETTLELTGRALDVTIDGTRGRVVVEEIVGGVPYARVWFYWRYEDGWRHVPPDYTFWGEPITVTRPGVVVTGYAVDQAAAERAAVHAERWRAVLCAAFTASAVAECTPVTDTADAAAYSLRIAIEPRPEQPAEWGRDGVFRVASPYIAGAYLPDPFDPNLQAAGAAGLAARVIDGVSPIVPVFPTDAYFFRTSAQVWLTGAMLDRELALSETTVASIAALGPGALERVLAAFEPAGDVQTVAAALGWADVSAGPDGETLDWRGYASWRLAREYDARAANDPAAFAAFYDPAAQAVAAARFAAPLQAAPPTVLSFAVGRDAAEVPLLRVAAAEADGTPVTVDFRLIDGRWLRAS
jgi:hypothetical protein